MYVQFRSCIQGPWRNKYEGLILNCIKIDRKKADVKCHILWLQKPKKSNLLLTILWDFYCSEICWNDTWAFSIIFWKKIYSPKWIIYSLVYLCPKCSQSRWDFKCAVSLLLTLQCLLLFMFVIYQHNYINIFCLYWTKQKFDHCV